MNAFQIAFTDDAEKDLDAIKDMRTAQSIVRRIMKLNDEPVKQGKPLGEDLKGFYSIRAAGQRYRVVYRVIEAERFVTIEVIGIRKEGSRRDVYKIASRRLKR